MSESSVLLVHMSAVRCGLGFAIDEINVLDEDGGSDRRLED